MVGSGLDRHVLIDSNSGPHEFNVRESLQRTTHRVRERIVNLVGFHLKWVSKSLPHP